MRNGYIAVLDSGIGGISVLNDLIKIMPKERYLYFGDNKNAPYGNKSIEELKKLAFNIIDQIKRYSVKCIVVGCNTLSVNLLNEISDYSGLPTFGVCPPVNEGRALGGKILLLATVRTSQNYSSDKDLTVLGLKGLVKDIEYNMFNARAVDLEKSLKELEGSFIKQKGYYNTVILGCTHYIFIKNKIFDYFCPQNIISGNEITAKKVKEHLQNTKSLVKYKRLSVLFIGDCSKINEEYFVKSGQIL
ncbi:MAG: aspartate/glutamate racemase family protein [Clostridia bacterium]|nr:aspartate/glutamate racemase family protein [Clostridia bacterium]